MEFLARPGSKGVKVEQQLLSQDDIRNRDEPHIHLMRNPRRSMAVSLHVYFPQLVKGNYYDLEEGKFKLMSEWSQ